MERDDQMPPDDAILLNRILEEREIPPKRLALECGIHASTLYRYLSGEKTLPSKVLTRAYELTGDLRIITLIAGGRAITIRPVLSCPHTNSSGSQSPATPVRIPPIDELLPRACKAVEDVARATPYMCKIIRDGKVDGSDRRAADNFKRYASETRQCLSLLEAALELHMEKGAA